MRLSSASNVSLKMARPCQNLFMTTSSPLHAQKPHRTAQTPAEMTGRYDTSQRSAPHGYSGFSGGAIFVAQAGADADADCAAALADHRSARPLPLVADRVAYVPVAAGQVACLVTNTPRSFELLSRLRH
jgi:hypothetical protein